MKPFIKSAFDCFIQELQASPVVKARVFFSQGGKYCSKRFKKDTQTTSRTLRLCAGSLKYKNIWLMQVTKTLLGYPYYFAEFNWRTERKNTDRAEEEAMEDYRKVLQFFLFICS
ncbi:UNVERIFIED_CONTAM: hypothetical protein K2H54_010310 [Gekko kuhli]